MESNDSGGGNLLLAFILGAVSGAAVALLFATAQVERVDRLVTDLVQRVEEAVRTVKKVVVGPVREGAALLAGARAILSVVREIRANRARSRADEEDALFI